MIFKNLFTPKWKHPKTEVRLAALDKLEQNKDSDVLKTMALEDGSVEIRKKALNKLNSLGLWWQAYKQDQSLKDLAEQHISTAVLSDDNQLDAGIKQEYIDRFASKKVLERLAFSESKIDTRVKLLKRLAQPKLIEQAFKEGDELVQQALLPLVSQYELEKGLQKSAKGEAAVKIADTLAAQQLAKVKPQEVTNATKMVLAKLNALREKQDYQQVADSFSELKEQWNALELEWLGEELKAESEAKFAALSNKLVAHENTLKAQFDEVQAALKAEQDKQVAVSGFEQSITEFDKSIKQALETLNDAESVSLSQKLQQLQAQLEASAYKAELSQYRNQLETYAAQLQQLPEFIKLQTELSLALQTLSEIKATDDVNELDETLQHQKQAYNAAKGLLNKLPANLQGTNKEKLAVLSKAFKSDVAPLVEQQQSDLKQARRKAQDVKRLIEQGRSKIAFGVFKGYLEHFEKLTPANQQQLEKLHTQISEQLEDIRDWQKYASAPKRIEMLNTLNEHLESCELDPKGRAALVKKLRAQWHQLGRVESDEEKQQSKEFDEKLELLFVPCRAFFAEQEQQRAQAQAQREALIEELNALHNTDTSVEGFDWRAFESQFNKLSKQWRNAGSVDSAVYQKLNKSFRAAHKSVQDKVKAFHSDNAQKKQGLVNQAQAQLESDNLASACNALKELQKQWQEIGFAGSKDEHTLWQEFRSHNDAVFAKRNEQFQEQKQQQQALEDTQIETLNTLKAELEATQAPAKLAELQSQLQELEAVGKAKRSARELEAQLNSKLVELDVQARSEKLASLRAALTENTDIPVEFISHQACDLTSEQLILRLEILAEAEVDEQSKSARMAEQVALLDDKLQGDAKDFNGYLALYLGVTAREDIESERLLKLL